MAHPAHGELPCNPPKKGHPRDNNPYPNLLFYDKLSVERLCVLCSKGSIMTEAVLEPTAESTELPVVETAHLITEDDEPVDNLFSEKQQRLLTESLYTSWDGPGDDRPIPGDSQCGALYGQQKSSYRT